MELTRNGYTIVENSWLIPKDEIYISNGKRIRDRIPIGNKIISNYQPEMTAARFLNQNHTLYSIYLQVATEHNGLRMRACGRYQEGAADDLMLSHSLRSSSCRRIREGSEIASERGSRRRA